MDVKSFYSSPEVLGFNRLPSRAAMVESRSVEAARKGESDRLCLDGEWEFYTFASPEAAFAAVAGGKFGEPRKMRVPSSWGEIAGFDAPDALLTGPETRSSSPVRVLRDDRFRSPLGFYPCGEGAGYAGGIVSAAVDGLRCAEALMTESR